MSTSPSWFDQEKFSRLVKKVGPKATVASTASAVRAALDRPPEKETRRLLRSLAVPAVESAPRTSQRMPRVVTVPETPIRATPQESGPEGETSLFPSPLAVPEPRSVSPLARRTTPLPDLKPIFEYEKRAAEAGESPEEEPKIEEKAASENFPALHQASEDLAAAWQTTFPGSESLSRTSEKEEARHEGDKLRDRMDELDQVLKEREELLARVEELSRAEQERDEIRIEAALLRTQLQQADEIIRASGGGAGSGLDELGRAIDERDGARRDYAKLREEFEELKREHNSAPRTSSWPSAGGEGTDVQVAGLENTVANLKREMDVLQEQSAHARDEASAAQRGLALSQKALQETRDALREASEGFSASKASVESLKHESATLAQENLTLQAQYDQLSRELSSTRAKLVTHE